MTRRAVKILGGVGVVFAAPPGISQEAPTLATNPFDRPAFVVSLGDPSPVGLASPALRLDLRTTMVGEGTALANINGQILSTGQSYEGYRVVSIREGRVVLTKDGERVELDIYARQRGEDEGLNATQR